MAVQLGSVPLADFSRPLDLLKDCHRRIERFLGVLLRVIDLSPDGVLNAQRREALENAVRYFREAAPRHTQDEEESLFPRLRQSDQPEARAALEAVALLEADHVRATALHQQVDQFAAAWLGTGTLSPEDRAAMRAALVQLHELYVQHIGVEDDQVFPLAGRALAAEELLAIGREMKARRACGCGGKQH